MVDPSRRDVLSAISTFGVAAMLPGVVAGCGGAETLSAGGSSSVVTKRKSDLIRDENEKPGTKDWMLARPAIDRALKHRCPWIEGYFSRRSDFLFQCSDTTWQAYNRWPSQYSLYDNGASQWYWGAGIDVSFDRPYGKYCQILDQPLSTGSGEWLLWEFPLAFWMEQQGFDVSYISNLDTHADAAGLRRAKGFLSVGHDEYYSLPMFHNLKQAIADGLNVAFLSGNTRCGLIELLPGKDGTPNRILRRLDRFGPPATGGNTTFLEMRTILRTGRTETTL